MVGLVEDGLGMVVGLGLFTITKGIEGGLAVTRGATSLAVRLKKGLKEISVEDETRDSLIDH